MSENNKRGRVRWSKGVGFAMFFHPAFSNRNEVKHEHLGSLLPPYLTGSVSRNTIGHDSFICLCQYRSAIP